MNSRRKGILSSGLYSVVHVVVNFLYIPVLLNLLGQKEYGLYQMVGSFFSYFTVFESSISTGVLKFYCKALNENEESVNKVLGTAKRIFFILSCILALAGIVGIFAFKEVYRNSLSSEELQESILMLVLLIANFVISLNNALYLAVINANERFSFLKILLLVNQLLQPLICIFVLRHSPYAVTVVIIQSLLNVMLVLARRLYVYKERFIGKGKKRFDNKFAKAILFFAGSIMLAQIADQIFWKTDQLILGKLFDTAVVAVYAVGSQIYLNYMHIGLMVSTVFFPKISKIYAEDHNVERLSRLFIKVGRIDFLLLLLVLSGFFLYGREFITIWAGQEYGEAYKIALIVMIPFTVDICQNIGLTILQVMDKYTFRAKMYFIAALLNVVLTIIMTIKWGSLGAAFSTAISMAITSGLCMNLYYAKKIGLQIAAFWHNILTILAKFLPVIVVGMITESILPQHIGVVGLAIKIILYTMMYGLVAFGWVMNGEEKDIFKGMLYKILRR